ncbi:cupin domain-containing protein [Trichothermofontia sichuanensis B231]|uniref:cupin domain-containing protein n=1 Tax=Trichothermofontia sichuanensis TaxID=3045816 RepID=UPI00224665D1|nr:cupin domain-containing protein [Trichothermofontia sichuanensis]UZQ55960.1 cupin domain-containing protein [Trichothermofontia sichuanensis B231]
MNWHIWRDCLALQPHPEGGYYCESYRSPTRIPLPQGERHCSTAIYYLLVGTQISRLHRLRSDEVWHFYQGVGLWVHELTPTGEHHVHRLGMDLAQGYRPQVVIPAGHWFCAEVARGSEEQGDRDRACLVGCTVSPGFEFADFEIGDRATLLAHYPQHQALIERFTPNP